LTKEEKRKGKRGKGGKEARKIHALLLFLCLFERRRKRRGEEDKPALAIF